MTELITQVSEKQINEKLELEYLEKYDNIDTQEAMIMANVLGINY